MISKGALPMLAVALVRQTHHVLCSLAFMRQHSRADAEAVRVVRSPRGRTATRHREAGRSLRGAELIISAKHIPVFSARMMHAASRLASQSSASPRIQIHETSPISPRHLSQRNTTHKRPRELTGTNRRVASTRRKTCVGLECGYGYWTRRTAASCCCRRRTEGTEGRRAP